MLLLGNPRESPQTLQLDLNAVSPNFHVLMFVITDDTEPDLEANYETKGQDFGGASVTVIDEASANVLFTFALDLTMSKSPDRLGSAIVGAMYRANILSRRRIADITKQTEPFPNSGWRVRILSRILSEQQSQVSLILSKPVLHSAKLLAQNAPAQ